MEKLGQVTHILNKNLLLVKSESELEIGSHVLVYEEVTLNNIENAPSFITIPKGKLKVIAAQTDKVYLLTNEVVLSTKIKARESLSANLFNSYFTNEIVEEKEGGMATLNKEQSLNLIINKDVKIGDFITQYDGRSYSNIS